MFQNWKIKNIEISRAGKGRHQQTNTFWQRYAYMYALGSRYMNGTKSRQQRKCCFAVIAMVLPFLVGLNHFLALYISDKCKHFSLCLFCWTMIPPQKCFGDWRVWMVILVNIIKPCDVFCLLITLRRLRWWSSPFWCVIYVLQSGDGQHKIGQST